MDPHYTRARKAGVALRAALCLLTLGALPDLTGCAPADTPGVPVLPTSLRLGTILSVRPIDLRADEVHLRAVLLVDRDGTGLGGPRTEIIVGTDDGATLSIVEPNDIHFRAGDRVIILPGGHVRLARLD
jgi:hypothetical protein